MHWLNRSARLGQIGGRMDQDIASIVRGSPANIALHSSEHQNVTVQIELQRWEDDGGAIISTEARRSLPVVIVTEHVEPARGREIPFTIRRIPMKWVTREGPKVDRIACPWLIKRFVDPEARIEVRSQGIMNVADDADPHAANIQPFSMPRRYLDTALTR